MHVLDKIFAHFHFDLWVIVGFLGQALFTMRFAVQWLASEKQNKSVIPLAFWWFSLAGGTVLLIYVIAKGDPVLTLGQAFGVFVYSRNLMLIHREKKRSAVAAGWSGPIAPTIESGAQLRSEAAASGARGAAE